MVARMDALTIQCRLVAGADTRRYLWHLMADANTPLITSTLRWKWFRTFSKHFEESSRTL